MGTCNVQTLGVRQQNIVPDFLIAAESLWKLHIAPKSQVKGGLPADGVNDIPVLPG